MAKKKYLSILILKGKQHVNYFAEKQQKKEKVIVMTNKITAKIFKVLKNFYKYKVVDIYTNILLKK